MHVTAALALLHVHRRELIDGVVRAKPSGQVSQVSIEEVPAPEVEAAIAHPDGVAPADSETRGTSTEVGRGRNAFAHVTPPRREAPSGPSSDGLVLAPGGVGDGWTFQAIQVAPDLFAGLDSVTPAPDAPRDRPPGAHDGVSRTGGLIEGLDASDRERGLGRGGPVLSAVEEAAHSPDAPAEGFAEYEVLVRPGGSVDVVLLRDSNDRHAWAQIAPAIREGVSSRHVFIPRATSGMRFVVYVEAAIQFPDGKRPADFGTRTFTSTGWGGKYEPGLSSPGVPMVGAVHTGKICSFGAAITPGMVAIGGACSPENIGVPAARVVHGRVLSEARAD